MQRCEARALLANGLACLQCTTAYLKGRLFVQSKTFVYDDNDIMTTPVLLSDSSRKENKAPALQKVALKILGSGANIRRCIAQPPS